MNPTEFVLLVAGMGVVTFLPRWLPLFFLSKRELPAPMVEWLELVPAAILSALLFPALLTHGAPKVFSPFSAEMVVAIPTFAVAWFTRSLGGTLVVGMLLYWISGNFL